MGREVYNGWSREKIRREWVRKEKKVCKWYIYVCLFRFSP